MLQSSKPRWQFLLCTALGAALPASAVLAQDTEPAADETIVVTGTRILKPDFDQPNPIVSVDSESIQLSGTTNLTDYLTDQPALVGSLDSTQTSGSAGFIGSTGLNLLNLRNLGTERTLVLVDGRRHVAQLPETAAVDVNTIPVDLIERIDIATGGVSAVYGADAVSGVVNFVMKKDFEGIRARGQLGFATEGEPLDYFASIAAGKNFAGGRGNIAAAFEYAHDGRLRSIDRRYLRNPFRQTMQINPNDPDDDPSIPDEIPLTDIRFFDSSRGGAIDLDFDFLPDVLSDGSPFVRPQIIDPFYSVGGSGTPVADYIGDLIARNNRYVGNVFVNYEVSDALKLFGELKYARGESFSESQPTFDFQIELQPDNPFVPPEIVAAAAANGAPILMSRDNFDLGVRGERNKRETWRGVAGLRGDLTDWLRYEASYVYGQSTVRNVSTNNRFNDRFFAAVDVVTDPATGQPTCRSNLDPAALTDQPIYNFFGGFFFGDLTRLSFTPGANSGCVPLNLFGEGAPNQAAIDFVMTDSVATSKITQNVGTAYVSGQVPGFELPGGSINFVLGGEWRRESSRSTPPPEDTLGQTFGNVIFPTRGNFNVKEAFGELSVPIFSNRPFLEELTLNGAARISDYSTVGTTFTWNVGAIWAPISDVRLRGTYSQSVRAPNIAELFAPQSQDFQFIDDPCDIARQTNNPNRAANCATILTALGIDPATFVDPNSASIAGLQRGNPDLSEETAKTWTAGVVLRPQFLPGLSAAFDWYDIKIEDAINTAEPEEIAENCVDQPTIDNVFCNAITRNPATGGIDSFLVQPENVASFATRGLDFNINYSLRAEDVGLKGDFGRFNFRLVGNYLDKLTFIPTPGAEIDDDRTEQYAPKWQYTIDVTWDRPPFTFNYGFNYYSRTKRYSLADLAAQPDLASPDNITYAARHTHDVQAKVTVRELFDVYFGIDNITNQKPDISNNYPVSPVGRFFYAGLRLRLGED